LLNAISASAKLGINNVELRNPFQEIYTLNCYVRPSNLTEEQSQSISKMDHKITVSPILCAKCTLTLEDASLNINTILSQHKPLFHSLGQVDPFSRVKTKSGVRTRGTELDDRSGSENELSKTELYCKLFDRYVTLNSKQRANTSSMSSLLGARSSHRKGDGWQRKLRMRATESDVDQYIAGGKLLVKGVPLTEEMEAVERTRQFLVDYHQVLNFAPHTWADTVLVLLPKFTKPINAKQQANTSVRALQLEGADNNREGFRYETIKVSDKRSVHVVSAPLNFKPKLLLEYMGLHLPAMNIATMMRRLNE
jgi:hypothetical protein